MTLRFGIFDHLERRRDISLEQLYEERLELVATAERLGFYGYHLAEHHHSPLCMAPSQSVFLAAAARHTETILLGTLVYLLPFYQPVRLIEEICMLDNLSGGRLQVGIGRGITAVEHSFWGMAPEDAQRRYEEILAVLIAGLSDTTLTYCGTFFQYDNVPLELRPKQRPYPPLWYAGNAEYAARNGMHFVGKGGARLPETVALYKKLWAENQHRPGRLNPHVTEPIIGSSRHVLVADTDEEAEALARTAWPVFQSNFSKRNQNGPGPETRADGSVVPVPDGGPGTDLARDFDRARAAGSPLIGSPETVGAYVRRTAAESGANYFVGAFQWGNLTHEQAQRSLELFATEVIPSVSPVALAAPA